jgi:hypothetical protein
LALDCAVEAVEVSADQFYLEICWPDLGFVTRRLCLLLAASCHVVRSFLRRLVSRQPRWRWSCLGRRLQGAVSAGCPGLDLLCCVAPRRLVVLTARCCRCHRFHASVIARRLQARFVVASWLVGVAAWIAGRCACRLAPPSALLGSDHEVADVAWLSSSSPCLPSAAAVCRLEVLIR